MTSAGKAALRRRVLAARRLVADDVRATEAGLFTRHLEPLVTGHTTVCAYVPVGGEPGSMDMLTALRRRAGRVLLPVARVAADEVPLPLLWGEYRPGELVRGRWGLLEPPEPWLPESAVAEAGLVIVPALAVDRRGVRLGKGRGFYDRSLAGRNPHTWLIALVRDEELVDELPQEAHDVRMTHVVTPTRGLIALPHGND
ncbi:5-formyltetrahydrofolate cyclo-ligase [Mycobacterium ostraviense]|uniref:5-formyltetrahydrofolate cyclo-ligase n=1 Tax=Mycobacterium ostraviense TaxID=2738409 RepID=A0A164ALH0_9MYCO|nr:5-formyltetrahydrofolate cyclo-ligase [Mycobacterium ostraviense]KZS62597.1 5-formyltetrahydrofolate cyclo-ligase [Mycobacterium ostraviense]UGT92336.1 5-formyltetrahydrofolate cyclo-ligase [Mycobacterium ostraviense]